MLVAFSDAHLTPRFDQKKFNYLFNLIKGADRVVIVGDWWDGHRCSFDQFVRSRWQDLFPLLKSKGTIYIYGNHDLREWCDARVEQFSIRQTDELDLEFGTFKLHFEHGHRIAPDLITQNPELLRIPYLGFADHFFLEVFLTGLFGERWINYRSRSCVQLLKSRAREFAAVGRWLICGHSHVAELDPAIKYVNCGFVGSGRIQYLHIDNNYSIGVVKARY
uniref:Calcineurin-like phosphoesterase domain-containing protein n=1 Tax=candidate division WWE3 bacterium TaxID=2053526 RepID=A0A831YQ97_UNCKA